MVVAVVVVLVVAVVGTLRVGVCRCAYLLVCFIVRVIRYVCTISGLCRTSMCRASAEDSAAERRAFQARASPCPRNARERVG